MKGCHGTGQRHQIFGFSFRGTKSGACALGHGSFFLLTGKTHLAGISTFFQALYQICLLTARQLCHRINMQDDEAEECRKK